MNKKSPILYPDRVALANLDDIVKFASEASEVTSPTIHSLDSWLDKAYTKFKIGTEGITINHGDEAIDIEHITPSGVEIYNTFRGRKAVTVTITQSAWDHALEALLAGQKTQDVKDDLKATKSGDGYTVDGEDYTAPEQDITNATGVEIKDTIEREKLALLFTVPIKGGHMYFIVPKVAVRADSREETLMLQSASRALPLTAMSLEDDEVAPFKNIYEAVTQFGLIFKFSVPDEE